MSDSCPLWTFKGFCYMYTLQVGIAIIGACGITLTTISLLVNVAHVAKWGSNLSLAQCGVQFILFVGFLVLGCVAYVYALAGAYREEVGPMNIALYTLLFQALLWLILTVLSFLPVDDILDWTCVQGIRCADRFFIHHAYYRRSQGSAADEYNWQTDEHPHKVFSNEKDCTDYCQVHEHDDDSTITERTTSTTTGRRTSATTERTTSTTTERTTSTTTERPTSTTTERTTSSTERPTSTNESPLPVTTSNLSTVEPSDTTPNATAESSTPETDRASPNTTVEPSQRNGICKCSPVKKEINTLIGKDDSTTHFVVSMIFIVFIAVFWYFYTICIFGSYITFLRTPIPKKSAVSRQSRPSAPFNPGSLNKSSVPK